MHIRTRKLIGAIGLVVFVMVYMALAMETSAIFLSGAPAVAQGFGYAFAGLIWVIPAGAIISWMSKTPR